MNSNRSGEEGGKGISHMVPHIRACTLCHCPSFIMFWAWIVRGTIDSDYRHGGLESLR